MTIRFGLGFGPAVGPGEFADAVDLLEQVGVDSLWLPELVYSQQVDPFVGMAHALSRTNQLKVDSGVAVLPGRHPVLVAKQLTSLAGLAPGRVLPVFGLRPDLLRSGPCFLFLRDGGQQCSMSLCSCCVCC